MPGSRVRVPPFPPFESSTSACRGARAIARAERLPEPKLHALSAVAARCDTCWRGHLDHAGQFRRSANVYLLQPAAGNDPWRAPITARPGCSHRIVPGPIRELLPSLARPPWLSVSSPKSKAHVIHVHWRRKALLQSPSQARVPHRNVPPSSLHRVIDRLLTSWPGLRPRRQILCTLRIPVPPGGSARAGSDTGPRRNAPLATRKGFGLGPRVPSPRDQGSSLDTRGPTCSRIGR